MTTANIDLVSYHVERARLLLGDQNKEIWTDEEMIQEIENILDEVAMEGYFTKEASVPISVGRTRYTFPEDFIYPIQINIDDNFSGRIVVATTYNNILNFGYLPTNFANTSSKYWNFPSNETNNLSSNFYYRDTVAWNEFMVEPAFLADEALVIGGEVFWGP